MRNPKILIIGTGSLKNYGCEAIVQGTYNIIKDVYPESNITLASDDFNYDRSILPSDIQLVKYKKRFTPYRLIKGIMRRVFHVGNGSPVRMDTSIGKKYDIVLSCGGDNYCEAPDHTIYDILEDLMTIGRRAVKHGKKYIIWGASVGPFHDKIIEQKVVDNISLSSSVLLREDLSFKYLDQFEQLQDKLKIVADSAFMMSPGDYNLVKKKGKIYVGVNMSELAVAHSFDKTDFTLDESKIQFAKILDSVIESNPNVEIILIPHVQICGPQDDYNFLNPVLNASRYKDSIKILPSGLGSRNTKAFIKQLDLLIAARMHCCVAGISSGTPTLFITYSNKGKGMSEYAYGHHDFELSCNDIFAKPEKLQTLIFSMLDNKDKIRAYLKDQSSRFQQDACLSGEIIKGIFSQS